MEQFDETAPPTHDPPTGPMQPRYRVPMGLPARDEGRRAGAVVSIVLHALIIGLLIMPFFMPAAVIERMQQGAGGAGPAGGGGGSRGSTGGYVETLRFVKLSKSAVPTPTTLPPVPVPVPKVEPPKPAPTPVTTFPDQAVAPTPLPAAVLASGTAGAGGVGAGGSLGAGPGSGGGIGAGAGTGKGGATGPGTGGGTATNSPPQVVDMNLPPMPVPAQVRGTEVIVEFDIDSTGRVLDFRFTETPDGSYNRKMASTFRSLRFRPGTRPDGSPLRMKAQITYRF